MMTVHPLHAGDGYTYLTREVATGDKLLERGQGLADYYTAEGTPPGMWGGRVAADLGVGGEVREDQMKALFGEGLHPEAEALIKEAVGDGAKAQAAIDRVRLGRRFARFRNEVPLMKRVRTEIDNDHKTLGRALSADECQQIRYRLGADEFHREVGRSPATDAELTHYIASQKRRERQPVAGYDCVFTPVKSVSVLWGLGEDEVRRGIARAHNAAVSDAIGWVEDNASYTRVGKAGVGQIESSGLLYTRFDHRDNRNGDPNLHTHVAISTKVQGVDGKWRSLDGRVLHKLSVAASERYNTLIEEYVTRELGASFTDRSGGGDKRPVREIDGMPPELLREFSRRDAIERRLEQLVGDYRKTHGKDPSKAMQMRLADKATLETREQKPPATSLAAQRAEWHTRAVDAIGRHTLSRALSACLGHTVTETAAGDLDHRQIAGTVVGRVSRQRATWNRWHIEAEVQRQLRGIVFDTSDTRDAMTERVTEAALGVHSIRLTRQVDAAPAALQRSDGASILTVHGNETYTSRAILAAERRLVGAAHTPTAVMASSDSFHAALAAHVQRKGWELGADKTALVEHFLFSGNLLAAGIGPAGTGKTTAMRVAVDAWRAAGHDVIALGPSAKAAGVLGEELGAEGRTIADVLTRYEHGLDHGITAGAMILVDEAGMASTHDLDRLTHIAAQHGAVVRLLGDPQQLAAVDTGGALRLISRESAAPELVDVHRFRDREEAQISLRLRGGDTSVAAWYAAKDRVQHGMADELAEKVFTAWSTNSETDTTSLMIASSNKTVRDLNDRARTDRFARGLVAAGGNDLSDGLRASKGDTIVTRLNDSALRVTGTRGERVRNGDLWTVETAHRDGSLSVRHLEHNGRIRLPADYVRERCELGYATTIHRSQGMTVDAVHVLVDDTMNRQALYVALTRGRTDNNLYVPIDRIVDPHLIHVHPDKKIADEVVRTVIGRDGSDTSATEQQHDAATAHRKLDYNVGGYTYADELLDAHRIEAIVREQMGPELAAKMTGEAEWDTFVRQFRRTEQLGLDAAPTLAAARTERELGTADSLSAVMHWRLERRIDDSADELQAWRQQLEPTMRGRFGDHAETILADEPTWDRLAAHLRNVERAGKDPHAAIAQLRRGVPGDEPTATELLEHAEGRWPLGRDPRDGTAPSWVLPPMSDRDGVDPELSQWSRRRYTEIAERTRELGQQAVDEQPAWTRHLGDVPDTPAEKLRWQLISAQVGAYREQFGIDTDRTLIGDRPEHGDAATAWDHVNTRINTLPVREPVHAGAGQQPTTPTVLDPSVLADRARREASEQRAIEQRRLAEQRKTERREQLRQQQARRSGPSRGPRI
ncbi:relaxase domain-containing protein [Rhodococcus fascians]|nr:relaxase domain-containing protein [Rhodococcus fascians]MBY4240599.1 relaxase domain-containing protein [Rhodococcus fascians]MBY4253448.1 relaxase domain-containing protein [Rhodococcus fascians]MBY4269085.1 relaxase domain-containing protein [Rhodococcus fascians]MBY4274516.1 relaxase domain-containing protein [Rhodococcus fascians]